MILRSVVAGLVLLAGASASSPAGAGIRTVPAAIDATGRADVTEELQRFLDQVPDGSRIEFPRGARYRIDRTLELTERHQLTLDGNGATLFATTDGDRNRSHVRIDGGSDLFIRRLVVVGANPHAGVTKPAYRVDREGQHGFELLSTTRIELDRVVVHDVYGDSVYIGRRVDGASSTDVWVHDSRLERTGRQGISVTAGRDVVIERNVITQTRRSTVDLEPNTPAGGASHIYISNNRVGPGRLLFLAAHGAGPVDHVVVTGNHLAGRSLTMSVQPPGHERRSAFYVTDNTSDTPADRTPMRFERVDGIVVRDNRQPVTRLRASQGEVGVQVSDGCSVVVAGNQFGAGTTALARTGAPCGPPPSTGTPAPPAIPARVLAVKAASSTASTSSAPEASPVRPPRAPRGDDANGISWRLAIPVVAVLVVGLGAVRVVRALRRP